MIESNCVDSCFKSIYLLYHEHCMVYTDATTLQLTLSKTSTHAVQISIYFVSSSYIYTVRCTSIVPIYMVPLYPPATVNLPNFVHFNAGYMVGILSSGKFLNDGFSQWFLAKWFGYNPMSRIKSVWHPNYYTTTVQSYRGASKLVTAYKVHYSIHNSILDLMGLICTDLYSTAFSCTYSNT